MDWGRLIAQARAELEAAGVPSPEADAELICAHVLGDSRGRVRALALMGSQVDEDRAAHVRALVAERARRVPLQHLTGRAPFRGIELSVGPGVFVPRPETEGVAQLAIDELRSVVGGADELRSVAEDADELRSVVEGSGPIAPGARGCAGGAGGSASSVREAIVVDLCTGSGAIALAIADEVPAARVWAVEKSPEGHAWAELNVREWGRGRVRLLRGDIRELSRGDVADPLRDDTPESPGSDTPDPLRGAAGEGATVARAGEELAGRVDVLVSNPPYVPSDCVPRDPEVRDHDPELALYSGADGLDLIRAIARIGLDLVRPGGFLVLEHAEGQGAAIRHLLDAAGWRDAETHPDLTGRDRATTARR